VRENGEKERSGSDGRDRTRNVDETRLPTEATSWSGRGSTGKETRLKNRRTNRGTYGMDDRKLTPRGPLPRATDGGTDRQETGGMFSTINSIVGMTQKRMSR